MKRPVIKIASEPKSDPLIGVRPEGPTPDGGDRRPKFDPPIFGWMGCPLWREAGGEGC
jgi:hypothetical protein